MTSTDQHFSRFNSTPEALQGMRDALPVLAALVPFGIIFGTIAIESGLSFWELFLTSLSIYAGASQYVMLDLMGQQVPVIMIVFSVFALNFRHVLYSAAIGRKLGAFSFWQKALAFFLLVDPQYAVSEARAARQKLTKSYYFSYAAVVYSAWVISSCLGAGFGTLLENPERFGLDFVLPLYFMALVMGFKAYNGFVWIIAGSSAASLMAYYLVGSPWHITIGGLSGLVVAAILSKPKEAPHE
ncbi:branched-chain amino acid ABC transporter permease [Sneathiella sp. P13V-1]|uniref:AzlC family ABC transporter permease n=1 Tax=Sneathiella sp. P13V-1 TaxID=2697366 RepID=UPI00187B6C8A|nr:AzlC family ABC transporter permease [Sneathiella sp. P13V-1]MBE7638226.1 branched-chain amino acid ABC transporter permease [Sneathiella sp. P13V-1]